MRRIHDLPDSVYPVDDWKFVESRFNPATLEDDETLFAVSNGYLGLRANPEENVPVGERGTYINGFYELRPIIYGEEAYGFPSDSQCLLNVTDGRVIRLFVDDDPFELQKADIISYRRELDFRNGYLSRDVLWRTPNGVRIRVQSRRLVSFRHRHLAVIDYQVTVLDGSADLVISSELICEQPPQTRDDDPRRAGGFDGPVFEPLRAYCEGEQAVLCHQTHRSALRLAAGIDHRIETECEISLRQKCLDDFAAVMIYAEARPGVPIRLTKFMAYHNGKRASPAQLCARVERTLERGRMEGFEQILADQRDYLERFWEDADVRVETPYPRLQQALRFNFFHVLQASARGDGVGVPAKGLTGRGYEGHYFWDTEIYVLPMLTYTLPERARGLLKFRYDMLERARQRAREVNQRGALFPWRTINGHESSAYWAAGTAQYHIDADITYALRKYVQITGDREFLRAYGAELLVETARLWADLGSYAQREGRRQFVLNGVTGPDEYTAVVNNNLYTNLMARDNLRYAVEVLGWVRQCHPETFAELGDRLGLVPEELEEWREAADLMFIPYDRERDIHLQDDSFMDKKRWDFANIPREKYPLLLHFHPLVLYRHQVIKQADTVLAMLLLDNEFSETQKRRNFDYYDPLTTGDSSLSACVQGIVASELGYTEMAMEYFRYAVAMDLGNVGGNVRDGVHVASMGGTWMAMVYGFAGLRDNDGRLRFNPRLPPQARHLGFTLRINGGRLTVELAPDSACYAWTGEQALTLEHEGQQVILTSGETTTLAVSATH